MFRKIDAGEIKGLITICFNPKVSLPDNAFITRCLDKLEFYTAIDFFLNDTARHADIVLPGSLHEEDEGTVTQVECRVIKINKAVDCPGDAREDWRILQDLASGARPAARLHLRRIRGRSSRNCASPAKAASPITRASPTKRSSRQMGVFWPCYSEDPRTGEPIDHPGTPRLFEHGSFNPVAKGAGPFYFPDGKARFNVAEYRTPVDDANDEYPILLTTGRVVSQFLSGTQTRRIGPLVNQYPEPRIEMHPRLAAKARHPDGDWTTVETTSWRDHRARTGGHDDPSGHGLHSLSLGRREERQPARRSPRRIPSARFPNTRCADAVCARRMAPAYAACLEPQQ